MIAWDMGYDAMGVGKSELSQEELDRLRSENLKKFYKNIHICKLCKRKYGSDINEKLKLCPDCDVKLKGHKDKKIKLSLASEPKHLNTKGVTTK